MLGTVRLSSFLTSPMSNWLAVTVRGSSPRCLLLAGCVLAVVSWGEPCKFASPCGLRPRPRLVWRPRLDPYDGHSSESEIRRLQILPDGLIYHPYLAGPKESRTGIQFFSNDDGTTSWYSTLGGQFGILRYGTYDQFRPVGIQFDIEASAQFRSSDSDVLNFTSTDVRLGFPVSIGWGSQETKLCCTFLRGSRRPPVREQPRSTRPDLRAASDRRRSLDPSLGKAADLRGSRLCLPVGSEWRVGISVWCRVRTRAAHEDLGRSLCGGQCVSSRSGGLWREPDVGGGLVLAREECSPAENRSLLLQWSDQQFRFGRPHGTASRAWLLV